MILESVKSFERLRNFHSGFDKIHDFIKNNDLKSLPTGLIEIDSRKVYCEIYRVNMQESENSSLEVHDAFIEIYIVLEGGMTFGYRDRVMCDDTGVVYDDSGDVAYLPSEPSVYLVVAPDNLIICFPKDAHCIVGDEGVVKYVRFRTKV